MKDRYSKKIEEKVFKNILEKKLFKKKDFLIVSISGGPDSTFLLHILDLFNKKYNYDIKIYLVHLNHNLRKEAKRDEDFVRELSEKYNAKLFVKSVDINKLAKERKESIELCGRNERQKFLKEIKKELEEKQNKENENKTKKTENKNEDNSKIKLVYGHHADDVVETFFLNIARGSSLNGMGSIKEVNEDKVRPIIFLSKEEILKYLEKNKISYVIDATNFETEYKRNKIRNVVVPYLNKNINSMASKNIFNLITEIWKVEDMLKLEANLKIKEFLKNFDGNLEEFYEENKDKDHDNNFKDILDVKYIEIKNIKNLNEIILKKIIYILLEGYNANSGNIEDIYNLIIKNNGNKYILVKDEKKKKKVKFFRKKDKIFIIKLKGKNE